MPFWIGPWEFLAGCGSVVVVGFFLIGLQTALTRCSSQNRSLGPGLVWLTIIPFFGIAWLFVVVLAEGRSLGVEFETRGMVEPRRPAQSLGLAMSVVLAATAVFLLATYVLSHFARAYGDVTYNLAATSEFGTGALGIFLGLGGLVLAIVYWTMMSIFGAFG